MAGRILTLVPDILIGMRIDSAARGLDAELESVNAPAYLEKELDKGADVLIVDLGMSGLDMAWTVAVARKRKVPVIGFGPHVDQALLQEAEAAGMDAVYPRSAFMNNLAKILRERLGGVA
jgi:DNA-binding NarL/FixJ family response regulator